MPETQYAASNGIKIAYETFGSRADPPVLLVMGLGTQMIAWPDEMCEQIADRGFFVIRYDNRDIGLSTHLDELPAPSLTDMLLRRKAPYKVSDMALDAVGLLDELGIDSAHVVGASMGGFIAQTLAGKHPQRVRSLTLIMTSTGSRFVGYPRPDLIRHLLAKRTVTDRAGAEQAVLDTFRLIGSKGFAFDEAYLRDLAGRSYERSLDRRGYLRQLAAVMAQPNRTKFLRDIRVPTVVMHGLDDPLVNVSGGLALAKHIPGAEFIGFKGMGHDLPRELWPRFADEICAVATRGENARG
ncbi:MAG TPA: alpha/beta hydrolase [Mycobacteriales bacterium]|nr:alpha/beta hydrolase [Mycobacteriales bacterium]